MKKLTTALFSLLLGGIAFSASAQVNSPVPPATRSWVNVHHDQYRQHLRQPEPPPAGGFWISEDNIQRTSPAIVHYYDDQQHQLQTDTLRQNRINLKSRAVIHQLNGRLAGLLQNRRQPIGLVRPE